MIKPLIVPQPNNGNQDNADPFSFDFFDQTNDPTDGFDWSPALTTNGSGSGLWQASNIWSTGFTPLTPGSDWASGASAAAASSGLTSGSIVSTSGSGLVFDNTFASGDSAAYEASAVAAEKQLESLFTNKITLNITFNTNDSSTSGDALTNSASSDVNVSYATLKSKLPSLDSNLPSTDPSGGAGFEIPEAYARLLGLSSATPGVDDTVTLNTYYNWSYGQDVINGITHELTEGGMGRIGGLGDQNGIWSTMDLFRYTSAGAHDYTDGRDGQTTYFSYNGIDTSNKGVPALSFNNEYNSSGTKANTGDTADWTQNQVFGSTGTGETLTLTQTELDVMEALGWDPALPQDIMTVSGNWQTPTDWSTGSMPITPEDAFIGVLNAVTATSDNAVTVNSIGTNTISTLVIGDNSTLTATDGTALSSDITFTWASGNLGTIDVDVGSTLAIGDTFYNSGTLTVGVILNSNGGKGTLTLSDDVTLDGGGTLDLGQVSNAFQAFSTGSIGGTGLTNVDDTITGGGTVFLTSFDNQASGKVIASQEEGNTLQVSATTFTNEGTMTADTRSTLDLGQDGKTGSLANTGSIDVESQGDLAISGTFTLSGSGAIGIKGAGGEITSDGSAAATLTNESSIEAFASGQIGDVGIHGANDLTFDNAGIAGADGAGVTLTLDTGSLAIGDGGATLEAENDGVLVIDSTVDTGVIRLLGQPSVGGTVEALSGGVVTLAASIVDGVTNPFLSTNGQVVINGGTFDMLAGSSDTATVEFTGSSGLLEIAKASTSVGTILGFAAGDAIELLGFDAGASESVADSVLTITDGALTQTFDLSGATYTTGEFGVIQVSTGYDTLSFTTSFANGGRTLDLAAGSASSVSLSTTDDDFDLVYGSNGTVSLDNAQAAVVGGGDTIIFAGGSGNVVSLYDTGGAFDLVSGSNGTVYLNSAQAAVSGGDETIYFNTGTGNAASLYSTAGKWDSVTGSNGTVYLNSAQAVVTGGDDVIDFVGGSGNAVTVSSTAGHWDAINGSNGTVYLTSGQAVVTGATDTIDFVSGSGDAVTVAGTAGQFDMVNGSNGTAYLTGGQAVVTGGDDVIDFVSGSGNAVTVSGTAGHWDTVNGSSGTAYLTSGQAVVTGGGDTVDFVSGSGNAATLASTGGNFDLVNATGGTIYLTSAQSAVAGGGNTMDFVGGTGNAVSLYSTGGAWDGVNGSSGTVYLNSAQAGVSGSNDTIDMSGTSSMTQGGASDAFVFQPAIGVETINGFAATDSMQFSASDFVNFSALLSHTSQSGANSVIKLDASDTVTLTNVLDTSLAASQFHFV